MEDGSLSEISDLFLEIFAGVGNGGSNIILLDSATSLLTSGSRGYVFEWLACAKKIVTRWPNVKVCPLVPLWTENAPGQFIRSLQELSSVFQSLFGCDPRGLGSAWILLSECIGERPPLADSPQQTTYSIPYPTSLSGQCTIKNGYFTKNQRCPFAQ